MIGIREGIGLILQGGHDLRSSCHMFCKSLEKCWLNDDFALKVLCWGSVTLSFAKACVIDQSILREKYFPITTLCNCLTHFP